MSRLRSRNPAMAGACLFWLLLATAGSAAGAPQTFIIDTAHSEVEVIAYRAGPLALLAHDHIVTFGDVQGRIAFDPELAEAASGSLTVALDSAQVDEPARRATLHLIGALDEGNRSAVRKNMLGPEVLDTVRFSRASATLERVEGALPTVQAVVQLTLKGTRRRVEIPVQVQRDGDTLRATGQFKLVQSEFGIAPYTSLFGAIAVADTILVSFDVVAQRQGP